MAPLMATKTVTPWAWGLLHHGEQFKVVERWQLGGVYRCWFWVGVGFSILYLLWSLLVIEPFLCLQASLYL